MFRALLRVGLLVALNIAAGDGASAAVVKPFTRVHPICGTAANLYFCKGMFFAANKPVPVSAFAVAFPAKGYATVSWTGTIFCNLVPTSAGMLDFRVDFQLRNDNNKPVVNAAGSMSVGYKRMDGNTPDYTEQVPANVMRAFRIAAAGTQTFRLMAFPTALFADAGASSCNFNSGEMVVTFIPD